MTKRLILGALVALLLAVSAAAQTFPLVVKLGVDPDTSATAPLGYLVTLDGGAAQDIGLPAVNPACKAFVGSATSPCVPFSVSIPSAGPHTVTITGYNLAGNGSPASLTFSAPSGTPSTPGGFKIIR